MNRQERRLGGREAADLGEDRHYRQALTTLTALVEARKSRENAKMHDDPT